MNARQVIAVAAEAYAPKAVARIDNLATSPVPLLQLSSDNYSSRWRQLDFPIPASSLEAVNDNYFARSLSRLALPGKTVGCYLLLAG